MIGIGGRLEKNTKIKILCDKAKDYNSQFEELEKQGMPQQEISKLLATQDFEKRHANVSYDPEAYKRANGINGIGGSLSMGFVDAHKTLTETKTMFVPAETNFRQTKELSSKGMSVIDEKTLRQQKEVQNKMKYRIYQDHLAQMWDGVKYTNKVQSEHTANFVNSEKLQKEVEAKDKTYNQRKNDLKWYSEEYVKTKLSLRK